MPMILPRTEAFNSCLQPETYRKIDVRKDEGRIMGDGTDTYCVESGEKGIPVLKDSNPAPARPSDKNSIKAKNDEKPWL